MRARTADLGVRTALVLGGAGAGALLLSLAVMRPAPVSAAAWALVFVLPFYGVGLLAWSMRPDLPMARLLAVAASAQAAFSGATAFGYDVWPHLGASTRQAIAVAVTTLGAVAAATVVMLVLLFPTGRSEHRHERAFLAVLWSATAVALLARLGGSPRLRVDPEFAREEIANPLRIPALDEQLAGLARHLDRIDLAFLAAFAVLALRYRRSGAEDRARIRWLFLIPLTIIVLVSLGVLLTWAKVSDPWFWPGTVGQYLAVGVVPAVLLVAIVRHRLLDIDVVIRKSLIYGALWLLIALGYVGVATAVGLAGSQRLPVAVAVVATVLVTVAFNPARHWLEQLADRWVFGQRLAGHELIAGLGRALEQTVDQQQLLERLADTVRDGLRADWAEVRLSTGLAAVSGERGAGQRVSLESSLVLRGERLGVIECGPRPDDPYGQEDERVLDTLARQASLAVHNASLTAELASQVHEMEAQAAELTASRARIVAAGDEERRRIERDLHDGAQQQVVALLASLRLARNQLSRDPPAAAETLHRLEQEAAGLHENLTELTRGIHPAVLSDQGLVEAIRSRVSALPLDVELTGPSELPRLRDEVEGAAYFVCSEALTNVMKHAGDTAATVRLGVDDDWLTLEVTDHGVGINGTAGGGRGLANMRDRVAALGGEVKVSGATGSGTAVRARLPRGGWVERPESER